MIIPQHKVFGATEFISYKAENISKAYTLAYWDCIVYTVGVNTETNCVPKE